MSSRPAVRQLGRLACHDRRLPAHDAAADAGGAQHDADLHGAQHALSGMRPFGADRLDEPRAPGALHEIRELLAVADAVEELVVEVGHRPKLGLAPQRVDDDPGHEAHATEHGEDAENGSQITHMNHLARLDGHRGRPRMWPLLGSTALPPIR